MRNEEQRAAFERLLRTYLAPLRRLSWAYAREPADHEDLFQEVALALWRALPSFRGDASERTWLYRVAHNTAIGFVTRRRRHARHEQSGAAPDRPASGASPERSAIDAQQRERLWAAVRALAMPDGLVVILHLEGLSAADIEAVITSRVDLQGALRGVRETTGRKSRLATEAMVVVQLVLAAAVLSAAGLIARSLVNLERAHLAIDPTRVLIGELAYRADLVDGARKQRALLDRMLAEVRALPGVAAASPVVAVPFSGSSGWDGRLARDEQSAEEAGRNPLVNIEVVVPEYFATFGVTPVRGRLLSDEDREGAEAVVVLSEAAARNLWGSHDAIGRRVRMGTDGPALTVVGIVPDTRYRDLRTARASVYFPLRQSFLPFAPLTLAVRTAGDSAALVPPLRAAIARIDPGLRLASASPFASHLDRPLEGPRLNALLLGVFAGASVALAAIGLFGVMAAMVKQRAREMGIRMALGATRANVFGAVMRRGLAIALMGAACGLLASLAGNRWLVALLYDVSPTDGPTYAAVLGVLLAVSVAAIGVPARNSARIDPTLALHAE